MNSLMKFDDFKGLMNFDEFVDEIYDFKGLMNSLIKNNYFKGKFYLPRFFEKARFAPPPKGGQAGFFKKAGHHNLL